MTKRPEPWKIRKTLPISHWYFDYTFGMNATCPDCGRTVFIPGDELEDAKDYDFCPYCGKRRYGDEDNSQRTFPPYERDVNLEDNDET